MDGTILVADDDRTIRTVLTQALTRAGCKVHATSSLMTLMRWVEEGKGDLVISDVIMPDLGGVELLAALRAIGASPSVLFMSGYTDRALSGLALIGEAVELLDKPFTIGELLARVRGAIDAAGKRPSAPSMERRPSRLTKRFWRPTRRSVE